MTRNSVPLLAARSLTQQFADSIAVDDVSLQVNQGDVLGLLGLNGAGKTSTLRMLAGVLAPTAGEVIIDGLSMSDLPLQAKKNIGYLPEVAPLYPEMRVQEYLVFAARLRRVPAASIKPNIDQLLTELNLESVARRTIGNLSKGFQQRVGLAQALVHHPKLIILDEPSSGLDPEQMREMRNLLKKLRAERGIIFSSHLLSEITDVCNRVVVMHGGRVVHEGTIENTLNPVPDKITRHLVTFGQETSETSLTQVEGVMNAQRLQPNQWLIETAPEVQPGQQNSLLTSLINSGLIITEFSPERPSLEALFSSLVTARPAPVTKAAVIDNYQPEMSRTGIGA